MTNNNDENITILKRGYFIKQGGKVKSWKKRYYELNGIGNINYWTDSDKKKYKGTINIVQKNAQVKKFDINNKIKSKHLNSESFGVSVQTELRDYKFIVNTGLYSIYHSLFCILCLCAVCLCVYVCVCVKTTYPCVCLFVFENPFFGAFCLPF